jgi:hypothetical protein
MTIAAWIVPLVIAAVLPLALVARRIAQAWTQAEAATSVVAPVTPDPEALEAAVPDLPA